MKIIFYDFDHGGYHHIVTHNNIHILVYVESKIESCIVQ